MENFGTQSNNILSMGAISWQNYSKLGTIVPQFPGPGAAPVLGLATNSISSMGSSEGIETYSSNFQYKESMAAQVFSTAGPTMRTESGFLVPVGALQTKGTARATFIENPVSNKSTDSFGLKVLVIVVVTIVDLWFQMNFNSTTHSSEYLNELCLKLLAVENLLIGIKISNSNLINISLKNIKIEAIIKVINKKE